MRAKHVDTKCCCCHLHGFLLQAQAQVDRSWCCVHVACQIMTQPCGTLAKVSVVGAAASQCAFQHLTLVTALTASFYQVV